MDQAATTPTARSSPVRKRALIILAVVVVLGGLIWLSHIYLVGRFYQSTDDAYISSDLVQITSEVPGTVLSVNVDDTQSVERGQVLTVLDPADAQVAINGAEAQLARAVRNVRGLFAQRDQLQAQIAQHVADLKRAQDDLDRRQGLLADGAVSGEELSHSRDTLAVARAGLDAAREQLNATEAQIQGTSIETHPQVLDAEAAVRNAALALHRTELRAPVSGVIAKRSVQVGQRVAAGAPLMALVPLDDVWVDANFKEVQLRSMRVGQPVTLHADLYGSAVDFHGRLAGLSAGSGSAFALLPAQNASGNWIKIVQRIPVRITLDPEELKEHPLRVGLSMTVRVDVHDTSGPVVSSQVRNLPQPTQQSAGDDPELQARIDRIVALNAGPDRGRLSVARAAVAPVR
ncbi:MAG TPA: HlyD family efflux transporter periplasmic adaptor subunit [Steroidobacteraceae bacterium]|jgi:membrane fusion protein (multidrug efflux system)